MDATEDVALITGVAGYIGSHMALELLERGRHVVGIDNMVRGSQNALDVLSEFSTFTFIRMDLSGDIERIFQRHSIKTVFHFAAMASVAESFKMPMMYHRNITRCTQRLVDAMIAFNVGNLIYSSTCAVYGQPDSLPITEMTATEPTSPYGVAKLAAESYIKSKQSTTFTAQILRYFNVVGARADGRLCEHPSPQLQSLGRITTACFETARRIRPCVAVYDRTLKTADGSAIRDYIHVQDLVLAHLAVERWETPQVWNVATGMPTSTLDFIRAAEEVTGLPIPICNETNAHDHGPESLFASSNTLREATGWKPHYVAIKDALQTAWDAAQPTARCQTQTVQPPPLPPSPPPPSPPAPSSTEVRAGRTDAYSSAPRSTTVKGRRTAICITGLPRAILSYFDPQFDVQGSSSTNRGAIKTGWNWAGVRRLPYPDNIWATALHTNVLDVLAYDGFDIFVLLHGKVKTADGTLQDVSLNSPPTVGGYKALEPNSVNAEGKPNQLHMMPSALDGHLPMDPADPRWAKYYASVRSGVRRVLAANYLQYVLIQTYHMQECNEHVNNYTARTGVKYGYKMRVRTDLLFMKPIPHPTKLDFGTPGMPIMYTGSSKHATAIYDKFGFGEAGPMDVYFHRYAAIFSNITMQRGWTTEYVLLMHIEQKINATIKYHDDIVITVIRPKGYSRGQGASTSTASGG